MKGRDGFLMAGTIAQLAGRGGLAEPAHINLRLSKARNGQVKRTRDASEYHDPWRMFGSRSSTGDAFGPAKVAHDTPA
jgi:hypothetical protein